MGREEGGGFRMGNTCIPVADYVKFKNKIKFKIFKKKKKDVRVNLQNDYMTGLHFAKMMLKRSAFCVFIFNCPLYNSYVESRTNQ